MNGLTRLQHAIQIGLNIQSFFEKQRQRCGNTFYVQVPGLNRVLFTSEPDFIADLFRLPNDVVTSSVPSPIQPLLGEHSLILLQGNSHNRERQLLKPVFQGRCLLDYNQFIERSIDSACHATTSPIVAQTWMQEVTLDVIVRAVFGQEEEEDRKAFATACRQLIGSYSALLMLLPMTRIRAWGLSSWDRFLAAREVLDSQIYSALDRAVSKESSDMIGRLIYAGSDADLEDPNVRQAWRDRLTTLLLAGFETTANTLTWALYYLTQHIDLQNKMSEKLGGSNSANELTRLAMKLPELDAFFKEVMRMHPVVPMVIRSVIAPTKWAGYEMAAGEYVGVSTLNLHYDQTLYPNPTRFMPLRFLDSKPARYQYLPFGGGDKMCLGYGFAIHEMKIILSRILTRYHIELATEVKPKTKIQGLALTPSPEIRLNLVSRKQETKFAWFDG